MKPAAPSTLSLVPIMSAVRAALGHVGPDAPPSRPADAGFAAESHSGAAVNLQTLLKSNIALCILLAITAANVFFLFPEVSITKVDLNDNVLHLTLIQGMVHQVESFGNPFDFITPEIGLGQPIAKYYQIGSHLMVTAIYFLLFKSVSLITVFSWFRFLALALMPITFYRTARLFEYDEIDALLVALVSSLVSGDQFGIDLGSYVWAGHGLFPQLVATHFLLLGIGYAWRTAQSRGGWILPGVLLGIAAQCNILYGYVGGITVVLMICLIRRRPVELLKICGVCILFVLPKAAAWTHPLATNTEALYGMSWMYDSFGAKVVLKNLVAGQVLDAGRAPVLTLLLAGGLVFAALRRKPVTSFLAGALALFVLLYFGRPFWGSAIYLFGIVPAMQLHRFIGPVQIFAVFILALPLGELWRRSDRALAVVLMAIVLWNPVSERLGYLKSNATWGRSSLAAYRAEESDIQQVLAIAAQRGGRAYAGMPAGWGGTFKVGSVPFYSLFPVNHIPVLGFLYIDLTPESTVMYTFNEAFPDEYKTFDVRTVIAPVSQPLPDFLRPIATAGRFRVLAADAQ